MPCGGREPSGRKHELYLMCEDIKLFVTKMTIKNVECSAILEEPWGSIIHMTSPGGGLPGVYEAKQARP